MNTMQHAARRHGASAHRRRHAKRQAGAQPGSKGTALREPAQTHQAGRGDPGLRMDSPSFAYVTAHAYELQGLRTIPGAAVLLALMGLTLASPAARTAPWVTVLLACGILPLRRLIADFYSKQYADVLPVRRAPWYAHPARAAKVFAIAVAVVIGQAMLYIHCLHAAHGSAFLATRLYLGCVGAVLAPVLLIAEVRSGALAIRPYRLIFPLMPAVEALLALLPPPLLDSFMRTHPLPALFALWTIPFCAARIVAGILDHRLLVRTLRPSVSIGLG